MTGTDFSCKRLYYVTPSYVDVVYRNGRGTKKRMVLENWKCGFVPEKNQYLGVSHLSGIPFSFPIILLSEISQPDYVHVNTCYNVQIMHLNANIDEMRHFV